MKHYTEEFDDNNNSGNVLPQMRSCSTATTIAHRRAERAIRRVVVEDDRTIASNAKSCGDNSADDERTAKSVEETALTSTCRKATPTTKRSTAAAPSTLTRMTNTIPSTHIVSATCMGNDVVVSHIKSMKMLIRWRERDC